ncbi:MAG: polysaccharide biosynthesis tyrosine autokinase, partial [Pseudomonadota bacterium]
MNREIGNSMRDRQSGRALPASARDLYSLFSLADLDNKGIDIPAVMVAVRRRKWMVGLITFCCLALAWFYLQSVTALYPATATVVLETDQEQVIDLESVVSGLSRDFYTINTETEILRSRKLLARVVDDMGLKADPEFNQYIRQPAAWTESDWAKRLLGPLGLVGGPAPEMPSEEVQRNATIEALRQRLNIVNLDATYVFELSIETKSPQKSSELINRLADLYILEQLEVKFEATQAATTWLSGRVADLKQSLERAEGKVEDYKSATPLVSEEELALEARTLKELRARSDEYAMQIEQIAGRLGQMDALLEAQDVVGMTALLNSPRVSRAAEQLDEIRGATEQAQQRRELMRQNFWAEVDRQTLQLSQQLDRLKSQEVAIGPAIAELEATIDKQSADLVALRQLTREAEATRLIYEHFLARMKEISVQEGIQQADARVLSAAIPSRSRSFPQTGQTLVLALLFGLMSGSGLAIWREYRTSTFRAAEDLEKATGMRVLGNIPKAPIRRRRDLLAYVLRKPNSALSESLRDLRTSVLLTNPKSPPKVIVSSSSVPREGKTTLAVLLAQNSAALGKKVLIIECDLRKRTLNAYFNQKSDRGLISVLYGEASFEEVVISDERAGVDVLPGEESPVNAADVFSS